MDMFLINSRELVCGIYEVWTEDEIARAGDGGEFKLKISSIDGFCVICNENIGLVIVPDRVAALYKHYEEAHPFICILAKARGWTLAYEDRSIIAGWNEKPENQDQDVWYEYGNVERVKI